jgi:hypothetical protein
MLAYLKKVHELQRKSAGKMTVEVYLLNDHGAIFGGVVRDPQISISITVMDVFGQEDYQKSWSLFQFYPVNKNNEILSDFKNTVDKFVKDFDKEWKRRRENYIKRHRRDCV